MSMGTKHVARVINVVLKYKKIFPQKDVNELTQFYIDRFNDSVRSTDV